MSISKTLALHFDPAPSWGDLYWLAEQAKKAGIAPNQPLDFELDEDINKVAILLITDPGDDER